MVSNRPAGMNLPNSLTIARIFLVPLLVSVLLTKFEGRLVLGLPVELVGAAIFGLASLTDWLDGYLARRRGQVTWVGQVLDPLADKLLISATLVSLVQLEPRAGVDGHGDHRPRVRGHRPAQHRLRARADDARVTRSAKLKMVSQVVAILLLILGWERMPLLLLAGQAALWVVMATALVSALDYYRRFNRAMANLTNVADFSAAKARAEERKRAG